MKEERVSGDPTTLRGKTVRVVEDEHLVGLEVAEVLHTAGCSVTGPVGTLQDALRIAVSDDLEAAVLDINLNGELVCLVARALKARGIPFIFTTGYADTLVVPPELKDAVRAEKPVDPDRLVDANRARLLRRGRTSALDVTLRRPRCAAARRFPPILQEFLAAAAEIEHPQRTAGRSAQQ